MRIKPKRKRHRCKLPPRIRHLKVSTDVTLRLDPGLFAWLEAVGEMGLFGNLEQSAVYLLRNGLLELTKSRRWREILAPLLREPYRTNNLDFLAQTKE